VVNSSKPILVTSSEPIDRRVSFDVEVFDSIESFLKNEASVSAVTQALAFLGGHSARLIGDAIKARPKAKGKPKARPNKPKSPAQKQAAALRQQANRDRKRANLTVVK